MKRFVIPMVILISGFTVRAQTVENIRVEQEGEKLLVNYRIGGSTADELYDVTLTCRIDDGPVFEPQSVIGDVGANIRGGKSFNTIVWDVFEDVDEIGSVEFFVKVDLVKDEGEVVEDEGLMDKASVTMDTDQRKLFAGYGGSFIHPLGVRGGYLGTWGGYLSLRYGGLDLMYIDGFGYEYYDYLVSFTVGATRIIKTWDSFRLHGFAGMGVGDYFDELELEFGAIGVIKNRVNVNLGYSYVSYFSDISFGVGLVF